MTVNGDKSVSLISTVRVGYDNPMPLSMTAQVDVIDRRKIRFINVTHEGSEEAITLGNSLMDHVNSMLDLERFALDGMELWIDRLRVQKEQIVFYGTAKINQFPKRK